MKKQNGNRFEKRPFSAMSCSPDGQGPVVRKQDSAIHLIVIFSIALKLPSVRYNSNQTLVFLNWVSWLIIVGFKSVVLLLLKHFYKS